MRRQLLVVCLIAACSGDDTNHHRATTPPVVIDDEVALDAAAAPPVAADPVKTAPLTEDMAKPYFSGVAAEKLALEEWQAAKDAFAALEPASDEERARVALMIALCDAELGHWSDAAKGFATARAGLPVIA